LKVPGPWAKRWHEHLQTSISLPQFEI
jgi:hypothetical protein